MRISGIVIAVISLLGANALHPQPLQDHLAETGTPTLKQRTHPAKLSLRSSDSILMRSNGTFTMGADTIELPNKGRATIMALAEIPELGEYIVFERDKHRYAIHPDGEEIQQLPSHMTFRITASSLIPINDHPAKITSNASMNDFLKDLRFKARIFRVGDLSGEDVQPTQVEAIGIPADIPADERMYRAEFDVGRLQADDRIVLEVQSGDGEPLSKFFFRLK